MRNELYYLFVSYRFVPIKKNLALSLCSLLFLVSLFLVLKNQKVKREDAKERHTKGNVSSYRERKTEREKGERFFVVMMGTELEVGERGLWLWRRWALLLFLFFPLTFQNRKSGNEKNSPYRSVLFWSDLIWSGSVRSAHNSL